MHDGRFQSLSDVVKFYARGVRNHPNLDRRLRGTQGWRSTITSMPNCAPNTAPRQDVLGITMSLTERKAVVAFLHILTDRAFVQDVRFSNPFVRTPKLPTRH